MNQSNWDNCIDFKRNEIVFENRNKLFGAYIIRREYPRNVLVAFFTACLFMGGLLIPFFINSVDNQPQNLSEKFKEALDLETFTIPPDDVTPTKPPVSPPSNVKELSNPVVVSDRSASPDVQMTTGNTIPTTPTTSGGDVVTTVSSSITIPMVPDIIPTNTVMKYAEIMPKFQGGDQKLLSYLSSNIKYPSSALRNNIEGVVYVSFVVDTTGSITNVQLIRGLYNDCDLEALKAVKSMPKWIPGSQNGNKVSVEMSLPVHFVIK